MRWLSRRVLTYTVRTPRPAPARPRLLLGSLEDRALAGSFLDGLLLGVLSGAPGLDAPAARAAADSPPAAPATPATPEAGPGTPEGVFVGVAPAAAVAPQYNSARASSLDDPLLAGGVPAGVSFAPGRATADGRDGPESIPGAGFVGVDDRGAGQGALFSAPGEAPAGFALAAPDQSAGVSFPAASGATSAPTSPTRPALTPSVGPGPAPAPGVPTASVAGFGLMRHDRLSGGVTKVSDASSLAPTSRLDLAAPAHGRRPAGQAAAVAGGPQTYGAERLGRKTNANATGVAGSTSPDALLSRREAGGLSDSGAQAAALVPSGGLAVASARSGAADPVPDSGDSSASPFAAPARASLGDGAGAAPASAPAPGGAGAPSAGAGAPGGSASGDGAAPGGSTATGGTSPGGGPTQGGTQSGVTRSDTVNSSFTFTLDASGSDAAGPYSLHATGKGTLPTSDANAAALPGSVAVTTQLHRGAGGVSASDPATAETKPFDANGSGLAAGFDADGYLASKFGVAVASAPTYTLTVTGGGGFTDNDSETDKTASQSTGSSETDQLTYTDGGTETYTLTVTAGASGARTYTLDLTDTDHYTLTEDDASKLDSSAEHDSETYHESDTGTDTTTDHESGTISAAGVLAVTGFLLTDTTTYTGTDTDQGSDSALATEDSPGTESDHYSAGDTASGTETVRISGTPSAWTATIDTTDDDAPTESDGGNAHGQSGAASDDEDWSDSGSGHLHATLHAGVSGGLTDAKVTSLDLTLTGYIDFDDFSRDKLAATVGSDVSHETVSGHPTGRDSIDLLHISSPDGGAVTVTEDETITDGYTDTDNGDDSWSDPYAASGVSGTESGGDNYRDTATGNDKAVLHSGYTVGADGKFSSNGFTVVVTGHADDIESDGGSDTVTAAGETDGDVFTDNATPSVDYSGTLTNTGGATTDFTSGATTHGTVGGTDTVTDSWGGAGAPAGSDAGTEGESSGDTWNGGTVSGWSGTIQADGTLTGVSGGETATGGDVFSDRDTIDDHVPEPGGTETDDQTARDGGTDSYRVSVTLAPDGTETETVQEGIDANVGDVVDESGTWDNVTVTGHAEISGPVDAHLSESGSGQVGGGSGDSQDGESDGGGITLKPTGADDFVDLGGNYDFTTTVKGQGYSHLSTFVFPWEDNVGATGPSVTVTESKDPHFRDEEGDTFGGGAWVVNSRDFEGKPESKRTETITFDRLSLDPSAVVGGQEVLVTDNSLDESVTGGGADALVSVKGREFWSDSGDVFCDDWAGHNHDKRTMSSETKHAVVGDEVSATDEDLADTVEFHKLDDHYEDGYRHLGSHSDSYNDHVKYKDDYGGSDEDADGVTTLKSYSGDGGKTTYDIHSAASDPQGSGSTDETGEDDFAHTLVGGGGIDDSYVGTRHFHSVYTPAGGETRTADWDLPQGYDYKGSAPWAGYVGGVAATVTTMLMAPPVGVPTFKTYRARFFESVEGLNKNPAAFSSILEISHTIPIYHKDAELRKIIESRFNDIGVNVHSAENLRGATKQWNGVYDKG